jgi:hypothetical protein
MMVELVGVVFRSLARFTRGEPSRDLEHVGAELLRLRRPPH